MKLAAALGDSGINSDPHYRRNKIRGEFQDERRAGIRLALSQFMACAEAEA